jgi:hypothetical protein
MNDCLRQSFLKPRTNIVDRHKKSNVVTENLLFYSQIDQLFVSIDNIRKRPNILKIHENRLYCIVHIMQIYICNLRSNILTKGLH